MSRDWLNAPLNLDGENAMKPSLPTTESADAFYRTALEQAQRALTNLREAARADRRAGNERSGNFRLLEADSHLANAVSYLKDEVKI